MLLVVSSHMQVINQAVARGMYSSYCATAKASQQRQVYRINAIVPC